MASISKKLNRAIIVATIDFHALTLLNIPVKKYEVPTEHSSTSFDLNIILERNQTYESLNNIIKTIELSCSYKYSVIDVYKVDDSSKLTIQFKLWSKLSEISANEKLKAMNIIKSTIARNGYIVEGI